MLAIFRFLEPTSRTGAKLRRVLRHVIMILFCMSLDLAQAQERLIYASPLPQNEYGAHFGRLFAEKVIQATSGEVEILVRQNGALGLKGSETLAAVRDGLVHIADMQMNQQVGEESIFGIESIPCLARGFDDLRVLHTLTRPHFEQAAIRHNQKILFIYPMPRQNLFAKKDVRDGAGALQGLRVRTIDKNGTEFFSRLGAAPIQMPWAEVSPALSTGLLDAVSTSSTTAVSGAFWDFLSHVNELHWQMNSFMATVNLDAWKRIPIRFRADIEEIAKNIEAGLWAAAIKADGAAASTLRERELIFSQPSLELENQMRQVCDEIAAEYVDKSGELETGIIAEYLALTIHERRALNHTLLR